MDPMEALLSDLALGRLVLSPGGRRDRGHWIAAFGGHGVKGTGQGSWKWLGSGRSIKK